MKTPWKKILAAAVIVSTAPANAIPVTFDFSGTVAQVIATDFSTGVPVSTFDLSTAGQAFSAQFIVDTDLFGPAVPSVSDIGNRLSFNSGLPGAFTSNFMINGESIDFAPYSTNRSSASFLDSLGVVSCGAGCSRLGPDQFNVNAISENSTPLGITAVRTLGFSFVAGFSSFEDPESATSWFDFSPEFDIGQIDTLPLLDSLLANVSLSDILFACTELRCQQTGSHRTVFNVTSATRTVDVPEPATLGLMLIGVAAAMVSRRRKLV